MGEIRRLGNVQFGEVVATALKERWSGVLTIENPEFTEYVNFQGGSIAGFSSAERKKLIGEILMAGGHIEPAEKQFSPLPPLVNGKGALPSDLIGEGRR